MAGEASTSTDTHALIPLSRAIELGCMLRGQGSLLLVDYENNLTCAWGAALDAMGLLNHIGMGIKMWPVVERFEVCPVAGCELAQGSAKFRTVLAIIFHLNDSLGAGHGWSRERIAAWVRQVEGKVAREQEQEEERNETVHA
jgi:hypothetical protein